MMDLKKTGRFISDRRKQNKLTQKDLAEKVGVTDKAVSRWETGRGFPDASFLPALARALGVSISEIVIGERIDLQEKAEDEIMQKIDQTVTDTLDFSQQALYTKRWKGMLTFGLVILGIFALFGVFLVIYANCIRFWSDIPFRYAAYMFLIFLLIPVGVPACVIVLQSKYKWITRSKTFLLTLLVSWVLLMAATAFLYPEFYRALGDIELLRYDFNDTAVYEVIFKLLPITWIIALIVNGLCLAMKEKTGNA
jgi:transcriptional regulator with XRE-family HTH domain